MGKILAQEKHLFQVKLATEKDSFAVAVVWPRYGLWVEVLRHWSPVRALQRHLHRSVGVDPGASGSSGGSSPGRLVAMGQSHHTTGDAYRSESIEGTDLGTSSAPAADVSAVGSACGVEPLGGFTRWIQVFRSALCAGAGSVCHELLGKLMQFDTSRKGLYWDHGGVWTTWASKKM